MAARSESLRVTGSALYTWGANSYGQLGIGHQQDLLVPSSLTVDCEDVTFITGGGGHTMLKTGHRIRSCGCNSKGQLGQGHVKEVFSPEDVHSLTGLKVNKICAGWDFTVLLTGGGVVYSWGSNAFGQLGTPHIQNYTSVPNQVNITGNSVDIAAGLRHALTVTDDGSVFSWGAGRRGQLGVSTDGKTIAKLPAPERVVIPEGAGQARSCVAGSYHSAVLTDDSRVVFWGCNKHGQAAQNPTETSHVDRPSLISATIFDGKKLLKLFSGWTHLLASTDDGSVYSWGRNDYGQLGRMSSGTCVISTEAIGSAPSSSSHQICSRCDHMPRPIHGLQSPKQICCGSEHNLALLDDGTLLSWGWNEHGICGLGHEDNVSRPTVVECLPGPVTMIGCGAGHSFALCKT